MREMDRIWEKLKGTEDVKVRREILSAQGVLLDTFAAMMKEARRALKIRRQLDLSLYDAEKAVETLRRHIDDTGDRLPNSEKALIYYIVRLGKEAILPDNEEKRRTTKKELYAASNSEGFAGVYSSVENAKKAGFDVQLDLFPIFLTDADTKPKRYVCMAEGEWTALRMKDGRCTAELCSTNPVWGESIQTCISEMNRKKLHGVVLKSLYIYEIDRTYSYLFNAADRFAPLFKEYAGQVILPQTIIDNDYIQQHYDEISYEAEYVEKYYSEDTLRILDKISEKYGLMDMKQKAWMRTELCRRLSKEELLQKEELMEHMEDCIPRRRHGRQRQKSLKDYLE